MNCRTYLWTNCCRATKFSLASVGFNIKCYFWQAAALDNDFRNLWTLAKKWRETMAGSDAVWRLLDESFVQFWPDVYLLSLCSWVLDKGPSPAEAQPWCDPLHSHPLPLAVEPHQPDLPTGHAHAGGPHRLVHCNCNHWEHSGTKWPPHSTQMVVKHECCMGDWWVNQQIKWLEMTHSHWKCLSTHPYSDQPS